MILLLTLFLIFQNPTISHTLERLTFELERVYGENCKTETCQTWSRLWKEVYVLDNEYGRHSSLSYDRKNHDWYVKQTKAFERIKEISNEMEKLSDDKEIKALTKILESP